VLDIGYLAAFLGGLLALISPCAAMLLPSFFAYAFGGPTRLLGRTGVFFLGLAAVLVPLGAGSGGLAALLTEHRVALIVLAGWVIIALGVVHMLGGGWSVRPAARIQAQMAARGTWVSTAGLGAAYGLAGFCTGPILGAVLTVAAAGEDPVHGALLLGVYALGMTAPLFALTVVWQRFDLGHRAWLRGKVFHIGPVRMHSTSTISGLLFVTIGALFVVFNGSPGLLTLDPRSALKLENAAATLAAHVADVALLLTLAAVVVTILAYRLRTHASRQVHAPTPLPTSTTPTGRVQPPADPL
jgi:cytochrome c biogenesis protein CcdA